MCIVVCLTINLVGYLELPFILTTCSEYSGMIIIAVLLINWVLSEACYFSSFQNNEDSADPPQGIWDETNNERTLVECECGEGRNHEDKDKRWNVFIYSKTDPSSNNETVCTGTIVTSNLIVTSHKCLTLKRKTMNVYELWKPNLSKRHMVDAKDILVSEWFDKTGETFEVTDIIYNPDYALNTAQKNLSKASENDLAIIRLNIDFTRHDRLRPICIPLYDKNLDIFQQDAYYYGPAKKGEILPLREIRDILNGTLKTKDCKDPVPADAKEEIESNKVLCIRYDDLTSPESEGGALTINSQGKAFLIGIATKIGGFSSNGLHNVVYFTNVLALVKYLEYKANKLESKWCKTPELILPEKVTPIAIGFEHGPWPWESLEAPVKRDESLDCVCGIPNEMGGRVVGGVTAIPYEFGWMSVLHLYMNGRQKGGNLCGGAIINDRLILTAAHCVVSDDKISEGLAKVSVLPTDVDVTVNVHLRKGDPIGEEKTVSTVLFHPDYIAPRKAYTQYYDYDVALIVLKDRLEFVKSGRGISSVCLPKMGEEIPVVGKLATVSGWGLTDPHNSHSAADKLQKLEIPIANRSLCGDVATTAVTDRFLCAGTLNMYKDAAAGDSGGPLMLRNNKYQWVEVGIVSWGEDVHVHNAVKTAALYTNVQKVLPFIEYHAKRLKAKWCKSTPPKVESNS